MPHDPKRIEAIRECIAAMDWFSIEAGDHWESVAGMIADVAYPEFSSDPPSAWLAPMTPTEKMMDAMVMTWGDGVLETYDAARDVCCEPGEERAARDARTKEQT